MDAFYVFYVNRGFLLQIDISAAMQTVRELQVYITDTTGVRVEDQVLLMNGGQALDADKRVSGYRQLGTESNPVFLFSRCSRSDAHEMSCSQDLNDLKRLVDGLTDKAESACHMDLHEALLHMPECARQSRVVAQTAMTLCARLVQEHQFLYQGWLALVANLDDSIARLRKRATRFQQHCDKVETLRNKASVYLQDFDNVLEQLKKIVLPRSLLESTPGSPAACTSEMNLYDWISMADTNSSLNDLVKQVREQFAKFERGDAQRVTEVLESVIEQSKNDEYREIRGMNRRFNQLDQSLRSAEEKEKVLVENANAITQAPTRADSDSLMELVGDHRVRMSQIIVVVGELKGASELFCKSKTELLNNIRTRLSGWIVQAYEKLHHANVGIVVFEEKFSGLKQRLDLVRQIREAPTIFLTAAHEVVRRNAFQKEFRNWLNSHSERCEGLYSDETTLRSTFTAKLEHHFLRVLFGGMFDVFPLFFVRDIPTVDAELPELTVDYVQGLRKAIPELARLIQNTHPSVFSRLALQNPMTATMSRAESFWVDGRTHNFRTLERTLGSSTWISSDETMDMSPGTPTLGMLAKSPPSNFSSQQNLLAQSTRPVEPLHPLSPLSMPEESISGSVKSAPIKIPSTRGDLAREVNRQQISEKSSHFSTPEDSFEGRENQEKSTEYGHFRGEDPTSRSQTLEALKPIAQDISALSKEVLDIRSALQDYMDAAPTEMARDWQQLVVAISQKWQTIIESKTQVFHKQIEILQNENEESKTELAWLKTAVEERDKELEALRQQAKERDEEIERLREENRLAEVKLQETKEEIYKQLTIEYELMTDQLKSDYEAKAEKDQRALRDLKKEIEKKDADLKLIKADPQTSIYRENVEADIRLEVEREFKGKIDLMLKGQQAKQEEAMARFKKDVEYDTKNKVHELEYTVKMLCHERDLLRSIVDKSTGDSDPQNVEAVKQQVASIAEREKADKHRFLHMHMERASASAQTDELSPLEDAMEERQITPTPKLDLMNESCFVECATPRAGEVPNYPSSEFCQPSAQPEEAHVEAATSSIEPENTERDSPEVSRAEYNAVATQTRVGLRSFEMLVNIQHVYEGSTVLVLWDERHSAYVVFCTSPFLHFVKESSVRRLGLSTAANPATPRRQWIVAKVVHVDFCAIRKVDNRYKLPVDARVYRVDVEGIPPEQLIATSRREATPTPK